MEAVLETQGLTKRYGNVTAVDDLSLSVPKGQVFGLLGPNGSGKTTTLGMALGLVAPTAGRVRLFGQDLKGHAQALLKRIGAIIETPAFYPYLTGRQNLQYFAGIAPNARREEVDPLLEQVGLAGRGGHKFATYSQGMKQRLGIAYALLGRPELVLLDEPTNGLDPAGMAEVRGLIRELNKDGRTVILSSHLLHEVELVCDSVAILSKGKLIASGNVHELLRQQGAVRLKTTDNARAEAMLRRMEWVAGVRREDGHLVASGPTERSWELTRQLAQSEVYVTEMAPLQVSLERYFLEVTGGESQAAQAQEAQHGS
ncbi:MAG: ABC transporter ATP-binding protein [Chloroflexi bacterium]|nr:ABC transporter ATP-binding protein [Chloroflexota bacterium]